MGNLFSVEQACVHTGLKAIIASNPRDISLAAGVILPGVGAFGDAMNALKHLKLIRPILDFIATGRPFMGICLGMQLLFTESEEFGKHKGLAVIPGRVVRFPGSDKNNWKEKVPEVGWNSIRMPSHVPGRGWTGTLLDGISDGAYMYFVHSFYCLPYDKGCVISVTEYANVRYCSSIACGNIFACQFHPEKSAEAGLKVYRNWAKMMQVAKVW